MQSLYLLIPGRAAVLTLWILDDQRHSLVLVWGHSWLVHPSLENTSVEIEILAFHTQQLHLLAHSAHNKGHQESFPLKSGGKDG